LVLGLWVRGVRIFVHRAHHRHLFSATYASIDPDTLGWTSWFAVWWDQLTFFALFMVKPATWWAMTIIFAAGAATLVLVLLKPKFTNK